VSYRLRPEDDEAPEGADEAPARPSTACPVVELRVCLQRGEAPPPEWVARHGAGGRDPALGAWLVCEDPGAMRELLLCAMRAGVRGAAEMFWRGADAGWGREEPEGERARAVRRAVPEPPPYEALIRLLSAPGSPASAKYPGKRRVSHSRRAGGGED
jgi:hypothetical protein